VGSERPLRPGDQLPAETRLEWSWAVTLDTTELPDLCRDLPVGHFVDGFHPNNAAAQALLHKVPSQLPLRLTRSED
jgi:hypothetical protein